MFEYCWWILKFSASFPWTSRVAPHITKIGQFVCVAMWNGTAPAYCVPYRRFFRKINWFTVKPDGQHVGYDISPYTTIKLSPFLFDYHLTISYITWAIRIYYGWIVRCHNKEVILWFGKNSRKDGWEDCEVFVFGNSFPHFN